MKKLRCFSLIDLTVVIGLILVLSGASLIMFGKVVKSQRDNERIKSVDEIYESLAEYYKSNFRSYPTPESADGSGAYRSVILGKDNDAFLQIALPDKIASLKKEEQTGFGYVYIYSNDSKESAIGVRRLEAGKAKCNAASSEAEIIKDYLTKDPDACYFRALK